MATGTFNVSGEASSIMMWAREILIDCAGGKHNTLPRVQGYYKILCKISRWYTREFPKSLDVYQPL